MDLAGCELGCFFFGDDAGVDGDGNFACGDEWVDVEFVDVFVHHELAGFEEYVDEGFLVDGEESAGAGEEGVAFDFVDHFYGVGFVDGADAHGDVLKDFDEDPADSKEEAGAELGVDFAADDEFDAFVLVLNECGFESVDLLEFNECVFGFVGGFEEEFDSADVGFVADCA